MTSDGHHLAASLFRIANSSADSSAEDVYARIANRLSALAGIDIRTLRVDTDDVRQLHTVVVTDGQRRELPARSLSEGTLRYLALCVLLEDPMITGLITMEEPENGIHPANLGEIVQLIRDLAVDVEMRPGVDNPLRQVIVNTHSPAVVQLVGDEDLLFATERPAEIDGRLLKTLRVDGIEGTWRAASGLGATRASLLPYLSAPMGAQISLFAS